MSNFYQLSLYDVNEEFSTFINDTSSNYFELFRNYISFSEIIPYSFYNVYYQKMGRDRDFTLEAMLMFFIYKNFRSISRDITLLRILNDSPDLRHSLGFNELPHPSQISRFKTVFLDQIHLTLDHLVSIVNDELKNIVTDASKILIADTTGFEAYVTENNPKFFQGVLQTAKNYAKSKYAPENFNPVKYAHGKMPKTAHVNEDISLAFLNGHFGYYLKTMILTDGLGIIQDIQFPDTIQNFYDNQMPEIVKDEYDSKTLIPSLELFFTKHPYNHPNFLLADSGFDGYDNYKYISKKDIIPIIPLNKRTGNLKTNSYRYSKNNDNNDFFFNSQGNLICRKTNLPMKPLGFINSNKRANRFSHGCPLIKTHMLNGKTIYATDCNNPCSNALYGRKVNIAIDEDYRFNSAYSRDSEPWINLYKERPVCERAIGQLKDLINIKGSQIRNTQSLKSTILLAGITQLIGVLIMVKSNYSNHLRAFKSIA
jgi:hypothetical protein